MVEVELAAVRVDLQSNTPVVLLQETGGAKRTLPIFIAAPEATAIAFALQGINPPRPMTHDLMKDLLVAMGATLERVVITELRSGTYFAELRLRLDGSSRIVSSRPSDAIALAARTATPLYVADDVLEAEGVVLAGDADEPDPENPEELVEEFKEFLDAVRPEDFSP
ncbi:MAG: bifunctional nuclease family protein [Acidimicrobiales bacterium]